MRNTIKNAGITLMLCGLSLAPVLAQKNYGEKNITKDETVIIKKEKGDGKTVIEIKDGTLYVNGEAVVTVHDEDAARIHKKIIIENGNSGDGPNMHVFNFDDRQNRDQPAPGHQRAMLGVMTDPQSKKVGALVKNVTQGSAAEKAGLEPGDIITRIDGKSIKDAGSLVTEIMSQHEPGDKISINYERDGQEHVAGATLQAVTQPQAMVRSYRFNPDNMDGDMPNGLFRNFPFMAGDDMEATPRLGVNAEDRADGEGVRVLSVKPASPAAIAGIQEGDVITRIGDEKVSSVDELQMNLRRMKAGDRVKLEYQRAGKRSFTEVLLPKLVKRRDL